MAFVGIDRDIEHHWIYQDAEYFKVWFEILLRARFSTDPEKRMIEGKLVTIEYGQFIFGRKSWGERLKVSEQRLRTLIKKLVGDNMLQMVEQHSKYTLYQVVNYKKYNTLSHYNDETDQNLPSNQPPANQQSNHQQSQSQQGIDEPINQQGNDTPTSSQPAANQQLTTQEQSCNKVNNVIIKNIYEFWNQQSIITHRELTQKTAGKINARLKNYRPDELMESISNYKTIISSELYWYTHKFPLDKFMDPKNVEQFMSSNNPFENFRKQRGGGSGGKYGGNYGRTEAENRAAADRDADLYIGTSV